LVLSEGDTAKYPLRGHRSLFDRASGLLEFPLLHVAVELELFAQVALELASPKETPRTPKQLSHCPTPC